MASVVNTYLVEYDQDGNMHPIGKHPISSEHVKPGDDPEAWARDATAYYATALAYLLQHDHDVYSVVDRDDP